MVDGNWILTVRRVKRKQCDDTNVLHEGIYCCQGTL